MSTTPSEHDWFAEHLATYLLGGLDAEEAQRFTAHAQACPDCAQALSQAEKEDHAMQAAFAAAIPAPNFEEQLIAGLRHRWSRRLVISPAVLKSAGAVAALLLLGATGFTASSMMQHGGMPTIFSSRSLTDFRAFHSEPVLCASNLRQIGDSRDAEVTATPRAEYAGRAGEDRKQAELVTSEESLQRTAGQNTFENQYSDYYRYPTNRPDSANKAVTHDSITMAWSGGDKTGDGTLQLGDQPIHGVQPNGTNTYTGGTVVSGGTMTVAAPFKPTEFASLGVAKGSGGGGGGKPDYGFGLPSQEARNQESKGQYADAVAKRELDEKLKEVVVDLEKHSTTPAAQPALPAPPDASAEKPAVPDIAANRKIIRTGQMDFQVESFDTAYGQIQKIASEEAGFIASTESQKLPNGKMTGSITVRCAPEHLDTLVLKLRALGELKNQKISAQDVTKQYTDLESQLRAARAMEMRLLEIIKTGNGQIKDLVAAEKELGVWREKIERVEGEIRFYNSQIGLSTLTIALAEKDVKAAAFTTETEIRNLGIEAEDVEKAYQAAQALVAEFKGNMISAMLHKLEGGQLAANIVCSVAPENAGAVTDRLRQLGNVARLEADRKISTNNGNEPQLATRHERADTRFVISLYNLANVAPRETVNLTLACRSVEQSYAALLQRINKSAGRVITSNLNQASTDQTTATLSFQLNTADAETLMGELRTPAAAASPAEILRLTSAQNPDTANVTTAKRGFNIQLTPLSAIPPRETYVAALEVGDVENALNTLTSTAASLGGRSTDSQLTHESTGQVTGRIALHVPLAKSPAILKLLRDQGTMQSFQTQTNAQAPDGPLAVARIDVSISNGQGIVARDHGVYATLRNALSTSVAGLLWSLQLIVIGLFLLGPWIALIYLVVRIVRRSRRKRPA